MERKNGMEWKGRRGGKVNRKERCGGFREMGMG